MNDRDIDRALESANGGGRPLDPSLLERISGSILPGLTAVRPLPAPAVLEARLAILTAVAALAGASALGFHGIHKLTVGQSALIFSMLAVLIWLAARANAAAMVPAARRVVRPLPLVVAGSAALAALFALIFHDYSTERFVPQGIACLTAGLLNAIPAGLLVWLVVRRGFALHSAAAGAAAGALAGLAGVLMLELHCPILEAPHVMLWHVTVIPLSALAGAAAGRFFR